MTEKIETLTGNQARCHFILSATKFRTSMAAWGITPRGTGVVAILTLETLQSSLGRGE